MSEAAAQTLARDLAPLLTQHLLAMVQRGHASDLPAAIADQNALAELVRLDLAIVSVTPGRLEPTNLGRRVVACIYNPARNA